jgi:hypothetical protein
MTHSPKDQRLEEFQATQLRKEKPILSISLYPQLTTILGNQITSSYFKKKAGQEFSAKYFARNRGI